MSYFRMRINISPVLFSEKHGICVCFQSVFYYAVLEEIAKYETVLGFAILNVHVCFYSLDTIFFQNASFFTIWQIIRNF